LLDLEPARGAWDLSAVARLTDEQQQRPLGAPGFGHAAGLARASRLRGGCVAAIALLALACAAAPDDPKTTLAVGRDRSISAPGFRGRLEPAAAAASFAAPRSGFAEINIYPGAPPNYRATAPPESVDPMSGIIHDVSVPTLRRYPVDESKSTGVAFIAFPGGGYNVLDMERQVAALAAQVGPRGISVFGLKSRVGGGSDDVRRDAVLDARRALRLTRSHAAAWGLDPNRIGTVSWSAGSHLALVLAGSFDAGQPTSGDPVERTSCRPDFMAVMCPWADGQPTSPFRFTSATPPIYLGHAEDDTVSPIELARAVDRQLQALGILEHLEVHSTGGHDAFDVGLETATGRDWPARYLKWLVAQQLIP
jgi:acetyl esterase/lipase